jgi:hypothetical protein
MKSPGCSRGLEQFNLTGRSKNRSSARPSASSSAGSANHGALSACRIFAAALREIETETEDYQQKPDRRIGGVIDVDFVPQVRSQDEISRRHADFRRDVFAAAARFADELCKVSPNPRWVEAWLRRAFALDMISRPLAMIIVKITQTENIRLGEIAALIGPAKVEPTWSEDRLRAAYREHQALLAKALETAVASDLRKSIAAFLEGALDHARLRLAQRPDEKHAAAQGVSEKPSRQLENAICEVLRASPEIGNRELCGEVDDRFDRKGRATPIRASWKSHGHMDLLQSFCCEKHAPSVRQLVAKMRKKIGSLARAPRGR